MHQFKVGFLAGIFSTLFITPSLAQEAISPYSAYGVGLLSEKGYVANNGMGNTGLAFSSPWFIPVLNPALLGAHAFTSFEAGLSINQNTISDEITSYRQVNGGLKYATLAFPILAGKYGVSIALRPYSSKNYNIRQSPSSLPGGSGPVALQTRNQGVGNISQLSIANGWKINKYVSVGGEANYNFGQLADKTIYQDIVYQGDTIDVPYLVVSNNTDNFSDFSFLLGTTLTTQIGEKRLSLGATYDFAANLNTTRNTFLQVENEAGTGINSNNQGDSINFRTFNQKGNTLIPQKISVGLAYYKPLEWAVSTEFTYQDWSQYRSFNVEEGNLSELIKLNVGGEYTPNLKSGTKYYQRVTYRAGLNISNGPLVVNNTSINSFGITFGSTLPISQSSNVNLAFEVGQRGTLINNLVRENYFNFSLSFTYNDRWFLRRQFD